MYRMLKLREGKRLRGRRRAGFCGRSATRYHALGHEEEKEDAHQPRRSNAWRGPAERRDRRPHPGDELHRLCTITFHSLTFRALHLIPNEYNPFLTTMRAVCLARMPQSGRANLGKTHGAVTSRRSPPLAPHWSVSGPIARAKGKKNAGDNVDDVDAADAASAPAQRIADMIWGRSEEGKTHARHASDPLTLCSPPISSFASRKQGVAQNLEFGEDAAYFSLDAQKTSSWAWFFALLTGVLGLLYVVWIDPSNGLGSTFTGAISAVAPNSEVAILEILFVFAVVHSGLAYLRPYGEDLVGARAYRVMFALVSLPLAAAAVFYFINHRYDGTALWNIRGVPGVHSAVWAASFLSFYLLYPSTFNILEVAAVDEPKLHMYESGITRITRHPQAVGQLIWCIAHTAWIGSSFMVATSVGLMAHHAFSCWHGDFRLRRKYGDAFEKGLKQRTSIIPFAAILDGRQTLPKDYWKEFVRLPYAFLVPFCVGAYLAHPYMQQVAYWLNY